jgi:arylsulfatase A-like enzyme
MKDRARKLSIFVGLAFAVQSYCSCNFSLDVYDPYFFAPRVEEAEKSFDRNQFLSFRKDALLAASTTIGNDTRFSLTPPLPSRLTFEVDVPEEPSFTFSVGVSSLGGKGLPAPVAFRLFVQTDSGEQLCFEHVVGRGKPNRWSHHQVDLSSWAGQKIRLTFATNLRETQYIPRRDPSILAGQSFLPAWGNPVLDHANNAARRRDIILISVDCLRADHVGVHGYARKTTPNIDRVAEEGVVFENASSISSWTLPTHMSMLTGLMPAEHGLNRLHRMNSNVPYLPEILGRANYETLGVVSGAYLSPTFGYEDGFMRYLYLIKTPADEVVRTALEMMLHKGKRNRFLFLHLFDAHWPYLPPRGFLERVAERPPDISGIQSMVLHREAPNNEKEIQYVKDLYDSEVAFIDRELGYFFEELRVAGLFDDALILITGDHGEGFYEHRQWQHSEILYNEVVHIPLIVKWPGGAPRGRVGELVSQLHFFPTLLETAGLESPYTDIPSLRHFIQAGQKNPEPQTVISEITWEPSEDKDAALKISVRREHLKYIATYSGEPGDEAFVSQLVYEELYDLSQDEGELNNLLPDTEMGIEFFRDHAETYLATVRKARAGQRGQRIVIDEELKKSLEALGYVEK